MYFYDHEPPHFYAQYAEHHAVIAIGSGEVLVGDLPSRALKLVAEWAALHRSHLEPDLAHPNARATPGVGAAVRVRLVEPRGTDGGKPPISSARQAILSRCGSASQRESTGSPSRTSGMPCATR